MMLLVAQKDSLNKRGAHEHLIYINDQGQATCATAEDHSHALTVQPSQDPNQPPSVLLAPEKKHTHETVLPLDPTLYPPNPIPSPSNDKEDHEVINEKNTQFQEASAAERESILNGQDSVNFREGNQWPEAAKAKLNEKGRACLTINHIAPMIETLSGLYRRNRTDLRCYPTENGDSTIADVLTYALKNIFTNNQFDVEDTEVFEEAVTTGRGIFEVFPDFDVDLRGQIKLRHVPWDMVVFAPHQRKDLQDCEYFFRWKWLSKDNLNNLYPDRKDDISGMFGRMEQFINDVEDMSDLGSPLMDSLYANPKTREIRLLECEEKVYYRLKVYVDPLTGFSVSTEELPQAFHGQITSIKQLKKIERRLYRLRRTILAGDILLEDEFANRPTPTNQAGPSFSVFPVYAYKRGSHFEGKVERLKDPQLEINKRRSQIVDIVNTSINNGWLLPKNAFANRKERQKFIDQSSTPGFAIDIGNAEAQPIKVEGGKVEQSIVQLEMNSLTSFRETSNVNPEMMGVGNSYQSGSAMAHRMQQGLMGNEYLFDNISQTKKRLGREILVWVQELYTPERILRIFMDQAKVEKIMMGGQEVDPNDQQIIQDVFTKLKDADLTQYDVTIGETGQSPTAQLANFEMMTELAQKGVVLPPQVYIELAPIPNKARILQMLEQASQTASQAEDKKYDTEITKTQIAAQAKQQQKPAA